MADRDELIEQLAQFLWKDLPTPGPVFVGGPATKRLAVALVDSDGDLGSGRRIAIIEPFNPTWGWDGNMVGWKEQPFRIVTPNPEEG